MNVKKETQNFYHERINKVVDYINKHLYEDLDVAILAEVGNYSIFHFHRIMRAYLGESLGAFVNRLRMETAATLLMHSSEAINNIAFKVGYENPSSFNKAFKKRYGISPVEFRKDSNTNFKIESSKIKFYAMENLKNLQPKIKNISTKKVVYSRALGDYNESAGIAWNKVVEFAKTKRLFGFKTEFLGISYDDPNITESEKLRYDACIVVTKEIQAEGEIGVQWIEGGKYAIFTHKGAYEKLKNSYDYIFGKWLPESGLELRNVCGFEKYLNMPEDTKVEKLKTEIYVPIQ